MNDPINPSVTTLDLQPPPSRPVPYRGSVKVDCGPGRVASKSREGPDEEVLNLLRESIEFSLGRLQERELLLPRSERFTGHGRPGIDARGVGGLELP